MIMGILAQLFKLLNTERHVTLLPKEYLTKDYPSRKLQDYFDSRDQSHDVVALWRNSAGFQRDHAARLLEVLRRKGRWFKLKNRPTASRYTNIRCFNRDMKATIQSVIRSADCIQIPEGVTQDNYITFHPDVKWTKIGSALYTIWFSADDGLYISQALSAMNSDLQSSKLVLPYQLFIDKANVSRLNRRSMYPIEM